MKILRVRNIFTTLTLFFFCLFSITGQANELERAARAVKDGLRDIDRERRRAAEAAEKAAKDAADAAKGATKVTGDVVGAVGGVIKGGLDATVGQVMKGGNDVVQGVTGPIVDEGHNAIHELGYFVRGASSETMDVLKKPTKEVGRVVGDVAHYIEENPLEATLIIASVAYGGYLIYSGEYVFSFNFLVGTSTGTLPVAGVTVAGGQVVGTGLLAGASWYVGSRIVDEKEENQAETVSDTENVVTPGGETPATEKDELLVSLPPKKYEFVNIPTRPSGDIPLGKMSDIDKIYYAMQVSKFAYDNPIQMYGVDGLPKETTVQEEKLLDAMLLVRTVTVVSEADQLVEDHGENPAQTVADAVVAFVTDGPVAGLSVLAQAAATPTVMGDGTLLSQAHIESVEEKLSQSLSRYYDTRYLESPVRLIHEEKIKQALEEANNPNGEIRPAGPAVIQP